MKKLSLIFVVFLGLILASCSSIDASLEREVIPSEDTVEFVKPSETAPAKPVGNYILLRYYATGELGRQQIYADLYIYDKVICSWDLGNTLPWDRNEEKLFFAPVDGNCPDLDPRNGVIWYVGEHFAQLTFQEDLVGETKVVDTLSIWALTSEGYKILQ